MGQEDVRDYLAGRSEACADASQRRPQQQADFEEIASKPTRRDILAMKLKCIALITENLNARLYIQQAKFAERRGV